MARTKGSKGKKTLAKEMGITLEEYERYLLMSPEEKKEFLDYLKDIEKARKEFDVGPEEIKNPVYIQVKFDSEGNKINSKLLTEEELKKEETEKENLKVEKLNSNLIQEEIPESDDKLVEATDKLDSEIKIELNSFTKNKKKKEKEERRCDRCHCILLCDGPRINLTYLTGLASYHRNINKDIVTLCSECAKKMSALVENFLCDNGNGVENKFEIQED